MGIPGIQILHAVLWIDADRLIIGGDRAAIVLQAFVSGAGEIVPAGIVGFALDDFAAIRNGEVVLAIVAVGNATRAVQPKQIWIELDRLAVVRDGVLPSAFFRDQPLPEERLTPLAETKGVFRIDCDRLGDIGDRLVEFTLFRPRHAAAGIGPHVPGIDPDRLGVVGQRCVVFMQTVIGDATVVVGPAIFRIDLDRLGAIGNGRVVVLFALVCLAPERKGGGVLRAELDGLAVVGNRAIVILPV